MAKNIKWQFLNAINENFVEGMDKHSIKAAEEMDGTRIFSYADREGLKDVSGNFCNWMKENHPGIKFVKDIKAEHIQGFLNEKADTCSKATLEQYASKFRKLENIVNATYGTKKSQANYRGFIIPTGVENTKIRSVAMSKEDFKKIEQAFENSTSKAKVALQLGEKLGLRVSEITKLQGRDIDLKNGKIHVIDGKGGRDRKVPIRAEDRAYFADLKARTGDRERICPMQHNSVNRAINRKMKDLGIASKYRDTSIHAIRKMYAQTEFERFRAEGKTINEALGEVSEQLGHSKDRKELMQQYVLRIK